VHLGVGGTTATSQAARVIRVMVLDPARIFAEALAARLEQEPDLVVVAVPTGATDARRMLASGICDVALCDDRTALALLDPSGDGRRSPRPPHVVVLADRGDIALATVLVRAGAAAWVTKDQDGASLLATIRAAQRNETLIPPALLTYVLDELTVRERRERASADRLSVLTVREREILHLYGLGLGRAEVAARLGLSVNTVRTHVQNLLGRLEVHSTLAAVAIARSSPSFADGDGVRGPRRVDASAPQRVRQVTGAQQYRDLRLAPDAR
jgi:DNA-binding NarL/FixJ family response regulator